MLELYKDNVNETQVGIDEVGRGCFMGPVVASAVVWESEWLEKNKIQFSNELEKIKDSKKLSENQRKKTAAFIKKHCKAFAIQTMEASAIDDTNILVATYNAMHKCIRCIQDDADQQIHIDRLLVDGTSFKPFRSIQFECITNGDNKFISIASASILAKVYRDEYIFDICQTYPEYDRMYHWSKNKGYGTKQHIDGIKNYGITEFHRKTFGICKTFCT